MTTGQRIFLTFSRYVAGVIVIGCMVVGMLIGDFSGLQRFILWLVCCISYGMGMVSHGWNLFVSEMEQDFNDD